MLAKCSSQKSGAHSWPLPWSATSHPSPVLSVLAPERNTDSLHLQCYHAFPFPIVATTSNIVPSLSNPFTTKKPEWCLRKMSIILPRSLVFSFQLWIHRKRQRMYRQVPYILHPSSHNVNPSMTSYCPVDNIQNPYSDPQSPWNLPLAPLLTELPHNVVSIVLQVSKDLGLPQDLCSQTAFLVWTLPSPLIPVSLGQ